MPIKLIKYFFFLVVACIPLVHWAPILDTTMLPRQIWFTGFTLVCTSILLFTKSKSIALTPIHWALLVIIILSGFSITYAFNAAEAIYTFNKWLLYASLFTLLLMLLQNGLIDLAIISKAVLVLLVIACGFQVYEFIQKGSFKLLEGKKLYEINSLFGHKNLFSSIVFLCFPFLIYLILQAKKWLQIVSIAVLLIALALLVLIQTKAVLLALVIGIGVSGFALFNHIPISKKVKIVSVLVFIAAIVFLAYIGRNKLTLLSNNDTVKERILLWNNTWQMIKENPVGGVGAGNWQIFFPKYGLQHFIQTNYLISDGYTTFQRPHNDFLWIWSELGLLPLLAYIGICIVGVFYAVSNVKKADTMKQKIVSAGFLMAVIGYVCIGLVDFPLERSEHQFFFFLVLSIICHTHLTYHKSKTTYKSTGLLLLIVIAGIFNITVFTKRVNAETHAHQLLIAHSKNNWSLMVKEAKKATNYFYTIDNFSIPLQWYAGVAYSALNSPAETKVQFENAYAVNPYQIHVLNNIASANEMEGKHDLAIQYYNEALAISPFQPDALLNKSAALFNKGLVDEAFLNILKFKFDSTNDQFKNYYLAIAKAKFEKDLTNKKPDATKLPFELSDIKNDTVLLNKFNELKKVYLASYH